jgi:methylthioribose-1-phosphate isomerase
VQHSNIEKFPFPVYWKDRDYLVLDQIKLPQVVEYIKCSSWEDVAETIRNMNLRGAPLIGAAASAAVALAFKKEFLDKDSFLRVVQLLLETRPTAVNLKNVLDETVELYKILTIEEIHDVFDILRDFSQKVHVRDIERNKKMGKLGADHIADLFPSRKIKVLTHCNAGALATCGYGTALGVIRALNERGLIEHVWVDETRPYLQGARLTAFEMSGENIPHKIITDSTAAWLMKKGLVDVVITGADRVSANGDMANKIGTYSLAVNARYHKIPFIGVMPLETFDLSIESGEQIVIEERSDSELLNFNGKRIAPERSSGLHLGFDVVPVELLSAIVTEKGVLSGIVDKRSVLGLFNEE